MKRKYKIYSIVELIIVLGIVVFWWLYIIDWAIVPGTYRIATIYTSVVVIAAFFHYRALIRFNRLVKQVQREELLGKAPEGISIFARNQRIRYLMRAIESLVVLVIGILSFIAVRHPKILYNKDYGRLIVTYFVGSIAVTGYLTVRDLVVLSKVRKMGDTAATEDPFPASSESVSRSNGVQHD